MSVHEIKANGSEEIVAILTDLLEQASKGKIQSIAICGMLNDATSCNVFNIKTRPITLLGELRLLERDVIDCCVDIRCPPNLEH